MGHAVPARVLGGLDQVSPVDVTASAIGTGASMSSGSASTSNANDLIFGAGASDSKVNAAGTGFTTRSTAFGNRIEDRSVSAAGSYSATARHNGNRWVMQMVAFKAATTSSDTTPPSQPNGLAATVLSGSQINLAWTVSTDNVGVTGYRVFRNGTQIATTTAASYNNTGLTPGTTYSYSITAIDAAGNLSLPSATVSATTTSIADLSLPTVSITGPASATTLTDIVTITADATDNVGVAGVQFDRLSHRRSRRRQHALYLPLGAHAVRPTAATRSVPGREMPPATSLRPPPRPSTSPTPACSRTKCLQRASTFRRVSLPARRTDARHRTAGQDQGL